VANKQVTTSAIQIRVWKRTKKNQLGEKVSKNSKRKKPKHSRYRPTTQYLIQIGLGHESLITWRDKGNNYKCEWTLQGMKRKDRNKKGWEKCHKRDIWQKTDTIIHVTTMLPLTTVTHHTHSTRNRNNSIEYNSTVLHSAAKITTQSKNTALTKIPPYNVLHLHKYSTADSSCDKLSKLGTCKKLSKWDFQIKVMDIYWARI